MRSRAAHIVVFLLLLSSLAGTDAHANGFEKARTPGGVFVRNLLLQASVEDLEPASVDLHNEGFLSFGLTALPLQSDTHAVQGGTAQAARVHSVTGSSL